MGCFAKFKCFFTSFLLFYTLYLYTYKCPKVHQSGLDHAVLVLIHPFSNQNDQLCKGIETAEQYVAPYCAQVNQFLDTHVHSHHLYKEYAVESKLQSVKAHYYHFVHPWVLKFGSLVELAEYHIAVQLHVLYVFLEGHYHKTVVPKVNELKETVAAKAETAIDQVKAQAETVKEKVQSKMD